MIINDRQMQENKMNALMTFLKDEEGVTSIEYALIALLIAMVIIGGVKAVGGTVNNIFNDVAAGF